MKRTHLTLLALTFALGTPAAFAQQQKQNKPTESQKSAMKAQADLHERIAKAHKNAASCLQGGKKSESECVSALSRECEATGATAQCMPESSQQASMQNDSSQQSASGQQSSGSTPVQSE